MLLTRPIVVAASLSLLGGRGSPETRPLPPAEAAFHIEHTPPSCLVAEKVPRLVACLVPRSQRASVRVRFRAEGGAVWYTTPLRSDVPCYSGVLPRPSRTTSRVFYVVEAEGPLGVTRRSEHEVPVVAEATACPGRAAPVASAVRPSWEAPDGAPRTPPGFEGAPPGATNRATAAPPPPAAKPKAPPPAFPPRPTASAPTSPVSGPARGGHGLRNTALVVVGLAATGGAAAVAAQKDDGSAPATSAGSGLPPTGVSGVYVGTETINYAGGCAGTDDIVLNLQEAGGQLSGVLAFTVRSCPCCAGGRGANPVTGALSGTSLQLTTPIGFNYSGAFAGNRLSGALAATGGVTGTWTVNKQ